MAQITITLSAAQQNRIINALATKNGYQDMIEDNNGALIPNPESKGTFVKRFLKNFLISETKEEELRVARATTTVDTSDLNNITVG